MKVVATGLDRDLGDHLIQGTWKFHSTDMDDGRLNPFPCCVLKDDLINAAERLVNEGPGNGEFLSVSVARTADGEIGIHFLYRMSQAEARNKYGMVKFADWLKRRLGEAYKGYSFGHKPAVIKLEQKEEAKAA